jgi:DNA replication and repair protein RecF
VITDIHLQSFRSYDDDSFDFTPGVNIIIGPNAAGKTNLLEGVLLAARGGSYRAKDSELVAFGMPWARVETHDQDNDSRIVLIKLNGEHSEKQFKINNQPLKRLLLAKTLPVVLFEPNHLHLLSGSPELRRTFLDDILEQTIPGYSTTLRQYRRVLAQRNSLLKNGGQITGDQLFVWNVRISEIGEQIAQARHKLTKEINEDVERLYNEITKAPSVNIQLKYLPLAPTERYASAFMKELAAHEEKDIERGFTVYGPHREDLEITIKGQPAGETASRGETRTLILVFKMIEAILLEKARGIRPVLLFDDVFSELDGKRRQALTAFLQPYQTFITTTDADVVIQHFTQTCNIIPLN